MKKISRENFNTILGQFPNKKIAVIGDVILDHYVLGTVDRISPEAPIPVMQVSKDVYIPGGAGNVAANIVALGGIVNIIGIMGTDAMGDVLVGMLAKHGIDTSNMIALGKYPTTHKTRVVAQGQQVVRIDRENPKAVPPSLISRVLRIIDNNIESWDAIALSDYAKGMLSGDLAGQIITRARRAGIPVIADFKPANMAVFRRCNLITPNHHEAFQMTGLTDTKAAGRVLQKKLNCDVLITEGMHGMTLFQGRRIHHFSARAREVADIVGAGDTVAAAISLGLASGLSYVQAADLANTAAGVVVGKHGTATVSPQELIAHYYEES